MAHDLLVVVFSVVYQARKFLGLHSHLAARIRRAPTISDACREAQIYHGYRRSDWDQIYLDVMEEVIEAKFMQHPSLMQKLLSTGSRELIDINPVRKASSPRPCTTANLLIE